MRIVSRQTNANAAAKTWRQRLDESDQRRGHKVSAHDFSIWSQLVALGDNPDPDDVDRIIGNKNWTWPYCCCCDQRTETVIRLADGVQYESDDIDICKSCIDKAAKTLNGEAGVACRMRDDGSVQLPLVLSQSSDIVFGVASAGETA